MVNHKLPPGYLLTVLDKVDSTNAEARRRAEDGAPDGTMIQGITQTEGRGRRGRAGGRPSHRRSRRRWWLRHAPGAARVLRCAHAGAAGG